VLAVAEAMSVQKPDNGWFLPDCEGGQAGSQGLLADSGSSERRSVRVRLLGKEREDVNALQALFNWLQTGQNHQAADPLGVDNEACQKVKRSQPLIDLRPPAAILDAVEPVAAVGAELRRDQQRKNDFYGPIFDGRS